MDGEVRFQSGQQQSPDFAQELSEGSGGSGLIQVHDLSKGGLMPGFYILSCAHVLGEPPLGP
jgi:hypothetical protein